MKVKYYIKDVYGMALPKRANETDAGYDLIATSDPKIVGEATADVKDAYNRVYYIEYETNLYIVPSQSVVPFNGAVNFHTDMRPRSSISKYNLVLANSIGLIDRGYQNQILARFKYMWQPEDMWWGADVVKKRIYASINMDKIYKKGDKIAQLLPMVTHDIEFEVVSELPGADRGGGFGSTGR